MCVCACVCVGVGVWVCVCVRVGVCGCLCLHVPLKFCFISLFDSTGMCACGGLCAHVRVRDHSYVHLCDRVLGVEFFFFICYLIWFVFQWYVCLCDRAPVLIICLRVCARACCASVYSLALSRPTHEHNAIPPHALLPLLCSSVVHLPLQHLVRSDAHSCVCICSCVVQAWF